MLELVGRLTALDPEASESLKVIAYFDRLIDGRVGVETMLRGAALLSGVSAGFVRGSTVVRVGPDGIRLPRADPDGWPTRRTGANGVVWIEREGGPQANDAMVLERLAIAITLTQPGADLAAAERRTVEVLLDASCEVEERQRAADRLRLDARSQLRAVASPAHDGSSTSAGTPATLGSAIIATAYGLLRATVVRPMTTDPAGPAAGAERAGIGGVVDAMQLPESWSGAVVALRLTEETQPVVSVDDLGLLAQLIQAADRSPTTHPDVAAIDSALVRGWSIPALQALAEAESVRSVARAAGLHHSTVQARIDELPRHLGFDPTRPHGRMRLSTALLVRRALAARFD